MRGIEAEIAKLVEALKTLSPVGRAELALHKELAMLTWTLRYHRMTSAEHAAWVNGLARSRWIQGRQPEYTLESRLADLAEELRMARG